MLTGFNTDFTYKGTVYHVQTEDNGVKNPVIITLLYKGGAILASTKTSYADILKYERLEKVVKDLMEQQHKQVIKDLVKGKYGQVNGEASAASEPTAKTKAETDDEDVHIEQEKLSNTEKGLDEVILDYLASDENK